MDPACFGGSPYLLIQYATASHLPKPHLFFKDPHHHMPYRLDMLDEFSNILYVQEDAVALSPLAHVTAPVDPRYPESCIIVGNNYSLKQMRAKAVGCFHQADELDPSFTSAWTLLGHEYVDWKQMAHAMEACSRVGESLSSSVWAGTNVRIAPHVLTCCVLVSQGGEFATTRSAHEHNIIGNVQSDQSRCDHSHGL
jgi:hypothetical protein